MKNFAQLALIAVGLSKTLVGAASFNDFDNNGDINLSSSGGNGFGAINNDGYSNGNRNGNGNSFNSSGNNNNNNNNSNNFNNDNVNVYRRKHKCQTERLEHAVMMKKFKDNSGYWVVYTQVIETRNVANECHHNEYVYLAHRQKAGWLWDPKINSLVQYSLGEPKFISRRVKHPNRNHRSVVVNMSQNYAPAAVDYDRIFPERLAAELTRVGSDDAKWSTLAMQSLPSLQLDTAYFQTVLAKENNGSQHLKVINETIPSQEVYE